MEEMNAPQMTLAELKARMATFKAEDEARHAAIKAKGLVASPKGCCKVCGKAMRATSRRETILPNLHIKCERGNF